MYFSTPTKANITSEHIFLRRLTSHLFFGVEFFGSFICPTTHAEPTNFFYRDILLISSVKHSIFLFGISLLVAKERKENNFNKKESWFGQFNKNEKKNNILNDCHEPLFTHL